MQQRKPGFILAPLAFIFLLLVAGVFFLAPSGAADAQTSTKTQSAPDGGVCGVSWYRVPDALAAEYAARLYTSSAISPNDVWAVGQRYDTSNGTSTGYAAHWNGATWNPVPSSSVGQYPRDTFNSVAAISSNNVWVVGSSCDQGPCTTLIQHWNGSALSIVPSPNVPSASSILYDVTAISANNIWAVGSSYASDVKHPLTLHWNGSVWTIVTTPDIGSGSAALSAVSAINGNDVWAVGSYYYDNNTTTTTISMHWNGTAWSLVSTPEPSSGTEFTLNGLAAISANDVWAVGHYKNVHYNIRTYSIHWNGTSWSVVPTPSNDDLFQNDYLLDISAVASNDVWATGYRSDSGTSRPILLHWDGTAWTMQIMPYAGSSAGLGGISMISGTDGWSVGYEDYYSSPQSFIRPIVFRYAYRCVSPTPTYTPEPTSTPTPEPPRCPGERFTDVCSGDYFYQPVLALNDAGIISGYTTSPPCIASSHVPCFLPANSSTRGQISKIISLASGFSDPVDVMTFADVPYGSTFYVYVERMVLHDVISGYPCGGPGEPCVAPFNRPYFRPGNTVTRGQLSKMVAGAFGYTEPVSGQVFEDVPPNSTFYDFIGRMASRSIINGYPCGGPGEACVPPGNRPYFRPANAVTRGQTSKIVYLSMTQPTATPTVTATPAATFTSTSTPSVEPTTTSTSTVPPTTTATSTPTPTETPVSR